MDFLPGHVDHFGVSMANRVAARCLRVFQCNLRKIICQAVAVLSVNIFEDCGSTLRVFLKHEVDLLLGCANHFGGKHIQRLWTEHPRMFQHMK